MTRKPRTAALLVVVGLSVLAPSVTAVAATGPGLVVQAEDVRATESETAANEPGPDEETLATVLSDVAEPGSRLDGQFESVERLQRELTQLEAFAADPADGTLPEAGLAEGGATPAADPGDASPRGVDGGTLGTEGHGFGIGAAVVALFGLAGLYLWRRR